MKYRKARLSLIKSFICRNQKGKTWLSQQYETYNQECQRVNKNNLI